MLDVSEITNDALNREIFSINREYFELAALIRCVEDKFLSLFAEGLLSGTVHTCVGQEFTAIAVIHNLNSKDWVTSNHRCHGHFIAKTGMWRELVLELLGDESGVCKGIGSSQHLYVPGFLSNGTQGSLLPVGTGIASYLKKTASDGIVVSFLGEGTLGEGVTYESLNIASLFSEPQLFVCENNFYSQSTPQASGIAGQISIRARAFGLKVFESNIWDLEHLFMVCAKACQYVRDNKKPAFLIIKCYRLNAHSKGDDDRNSDEVISFRQVDPLSRWLDEPKNRDIYTSIQTQVDLFVGACLAKGVSVGNVDEYKAQLVGRIRSVKVKAFSNERVLMSAALNSGYRNQLVDHGAVFIGEDIADPYGGAFKITKGFSTARPQQVFSTPISEAGLTGYGIGKALMGDHVFCEIMFGDFIVNAADQIINNACKFPSMYAGKLLCPLRVRTPMGGGRGYGPTHSQSLEKLFCGVENLTVFSPTSLRDPRPLLEYVRGVESPTLIVENKTDYAARLISSREELIFEEIGGPAGTISIRARGGDCGLVIAAYGGLARKIYDHYEDLFKAIDERIHLLVPQILHPIPLSHFQRFVAKSGKLLVVEEGIANFGWSSELISQLLKAGVSFKSDAIGAAAVSIPSPREMEEMVLPSISAIELAARKLMDA